MSGDRIWNVNRNSGADIRRQAVWGQLTCGVRTNKLTVADFIRGNEMFNSAQPIKLMREEYDEDAQEFAAE